MVDGNVSGSNLTFEANHSLSKAISGTIGDLASLNVNKGTLAYDKQTGTIGNLNVSGGLDIGTNTVNAKNVDFKDNSTLKFTVAGKEDGSYGKIKADTINVSTTGTKLDLTLNSSVLSKDETKEFTILDGTVTNDFAELSQNSRYKFEKVGNGVYKITGQLQQQIRLWKLEAQLIMQEPQQLGIVFLWIIRPVLFRAKLQMYWQTLPAKPIRQPDKKLILTR